MAALAIAGAAAFIGVFYLYPISNMLWRGRSWSTIVDLLGTQATWEIIWFTFRFFKKII